MAMLSNRHRVQSKVVQFFRLSVALSAMVMAGCGGGGETSSSLTPASSQGGGSSTPSSYTLTVSRNGSGTVTSAPSGINCGSDCSETYSNGASITLTAAAASGYTFTGWSGTGISCGSTTSCAVTMNAARNVTATFSPVSASNYTLQVSLSGSGSVSSNPSGITCGSDCSESYTSGTSVTLTAATNSGYSFSGWNGSSCSGTGTCMVSMTAARSVTATFTPNTFDLTVGVSGSGSVSSAPSGITCGSDCSETYANGTSVTLTATPASGSTFSNWGGACSGTGSCVVSMTAARNVTATFATTSGGTPTATYLVSWQAVSDSRVTGYRVYYSLLPFGSGGVPVSLDLAGTGTSYIFNPALAGLTRGVTVYFAISAIGSGLESPLSDPSTITVE